MRFETKIRIESSDMASIEKLDQAFNLVGGRDLPEDDQKLFGRIRGNDFSLSDAETAVAAIRKRAGELLHKASSSEVFLDPKLQESWSEGVRAAAQLGTRLANEFMDDLRGDMASIPG